MTQGDESHPAQRAGLAPADVGARRPLVSLVMPTYNSVAYAAGNVDRAVRFLAGNGINAEVIVADDGSSDGTADSIESGPDIAVLRLPHRGKGAALRAGMAAASGSVRAFTDGDLPYGLDPIVPAIAYIRDRGFHAVLGDRTLPGATYVPAGRVRSAISSVAGFTFRTLLTGGVYDTQCGFKVFRGDIAGELFRLSSINGFAIDVELIYLLLKYRLDVKRIPVHLQRNAPSSVRVVQDSLVALREVSAIRWRWAQGRYASPLLNSALLDSGFELAPRIEEPTDQAPFASDSLAL